MFRREYVEGTVFQPVPAAWRGLCSHLPLLAGALLHVRVLKVRFGSLKTGGRKTELSALPSRACRALFQTE